MLHLLALAAATMPAIVSTDWLQSHLDDPQVRIICVCEDDSYRTGHIPGARQLDHMQTVQMGPAGHRLAPIENLVRTLSKAGAADGAHVVLYGESPMATGWVNTAFVSLGHGDDVSWLDGSFALWKMEKRPAATAAPPAAAGQLTPRPAPDVIVDAAWVKARLASASTKVLDVRTDREWKGGHLPNATLVLWQDLFADQKTQKFKSPEEIRALLARAGVKPGDEVVTYCAVGMRASLMAWAARSVGVPARVYLGSWQDWSASPANPVVR